MILWFDLGLIEIKVRRESKFNMGIKKATFVSTKLSVRNSGNDVIKAFIKADDI